MAINGNFNGLTAAQVVGTLKANDAVPVTLAEQLRGSLRTVTDIAERDSIPGRKLDNGMIVFVESTGTHYVYKNGSRVTTTGIMSGGNWSTFTSGSGGSGSGAGLQEFSATSSYSNNDVVLFGGSFFFTDRDIVTTGTCVIAGSTDKTNQTAAQCSTDGGTFTADARPNPGVTNITTLINGGFSGSVNTLTVDSTAGFPYAGIVTVANGNAFIYSSSTATTFVGESQALESVADNSVVTFDNPWNIVTLSLVEKWDGSALIGTDGQALTGTPLTTARATARTSLGGNATESVDGFMSSSDKEQINDLPQTYKTLTEYSKGTQVSFNGSIFVAHIDISVTNTDNPTELSKWRAVSDVSISPASSSTTQFGININTEDDGVVIPGATKLAAGVMSTEDKIQIDNLPENYSNTKEYNNLDQVSLDGFIYVYFSVTKSTGNSPDATDSAFWNRLGGVDLVSSTTVNTGSVTIQNTAGVDAVIAPADSNNPGVMPAADKVNLDALPNEWVTGTAYTEGDQVSHDNIIYSVINDHTSVGNGIPNDTNYSPLGSDTETNLTITNHGTDSLRIDSDQGTDAVVPAATKILAGLLTATDKRRVDTIPTEWSSTTVYGGESLVSLNETIYVSLTGSTNQQPALQGIVYTLGTAAVGTASIRAVVDGVSTTLSTFTTNLGTTVSVLVDRLVSNFSSSEYTIAENSAGDGVIVTKNDRNPFTLLADVVNTGFTASAFNATAEFWQEELDYIKTRGINVLVNDPTNPFDGQVWYNSTEDFIKYFTAIDSTNETECLAHGGTFTSGACSIDGVIEIVNHTANNFETTSVPVADTGSRVRMLIEDTSVPTGIGAQGRSALITFNDNDGNPVPVFNGVGQPASLGVFTLSTGGTATQWHTSGGLSIGNGTLSASQTATNLANEITAGSGVTNRGGFTWNITATVDPTNVNAIIFSRSDTSENINIVITDTFNLTGITFQNFSPSWTSNTTDLGVVSNPDTHTAVAGQRFLKGSFSCFTASTAFGTRAYVYLGTDYITESTASSSNNELDPQAHPDWHDITNTSGGGTTGISQGTADSLYYRRTLADTTFYGRTLADTTFASKTELVDYSKFSDLGIRDVPGEDSVLYHSGFAFQKPSRS